MDVSLTPKAVEAIKFAEEEAASLGQDVAALHVLLGIMRIGQGVSHAVLLSYGVSLEKLRIAIAQSAPKMRMEDLRADAEQQAQLTSYRCLGVEHLFLALLDQGQAEVEPLCSRLQVPRLACITQVMEAVVPRTVSGMPGGDLSVVAVSEKGLVCPKCGACYPIDSGVTDQMAMCDACGEVFWLKTSEP